VAVRRTFSSVAVAISLVALTHGQGLPTGTQDFPFLPALPDARLIATKSIEGPLELRSAAADSEAVLAGMSYIQNTYQPPAGLTASLFIATFRDALFAAGWKLIASTKLEEATAQPETVSVSASYASNGRLIFARLSQEPDGPYQVNVADVGAEDWPAALTKDCRLRPYSIQFDLDRPSLRSEATPTLEKLAEVLKARSAPAVQIQGHTDNIGAAGDAARQLLSEARAKAVMAWLVEHGVPAAKLSSKGYGKTRPVAANDSDLGRAMNRRIEIVTTGCSR
jgi:OOP family OmpA-OmpF porin